MDYFGANRAHWNARVDNHVGSAFYNVDGFLAGDCTLKEEDLQLAGDPSGKSLVHLQCHFGLDTLSWARRGAEVTGLDFSEKAIAAADDLAKRANLSARFVHADVYDAVDALGARYDIVFTGVGALVWLPDIRRWATIVAELLNPGGVLVLREMHPMLYTIDDSRKDGVLAVRYPYFETEVPFDEESDGTYADPEAKFEPAKSYCWNHGVGEIVQALLDAGLILERLEETKRCDWEPLPHHSMTKGDQSMWSLEGREELVPMMLAIRARKPA